MKVPNEIRTYCSHCKCHTISTISLYKKGKERSMSLGARKHSIDKKGYGGQKFPELKRSAKTTKKQTMKFKCNKCHHQIVRYGIRVKKLEIVK